VFLGKFAGLFQKRIGGRFLFPGFFFSYEMFRNFVTGAGGTTPTGVVTGTYATLPTDLMRNGNFSQVLTGRQLGTDSQGRPILENTIYDPATARTINGQVITDPFQGNLIPNNRFDPVAGKIQALIPATTNSALINNPVPHVLMLTAIVVSVSVTGVALALMQRIHRRYGTLEENEILEQIDR